MIYIFMADKNELIIDVEGFENIEIPNGVFDGTLDSLEFDTEKGGFYNSWQVTGLEQVALTIGDFDKYIKPFLPQWQKAKEEQEEQFRVDSLSYTEKFNEGLLAEEEYANAIRAERNVKISQIESSNDYKKTQRLALLGDTTAITELEKFEEQIQALREIPQQEGFPTSFKGFV